MPLFSLEAVYAKKGDALILHYGPEDKTKMILIDGGPRGVYKRYLRPRLMQLREDMKIADDKALPFEMMMVSHIDDDHIAGILDLFSEVLRAKERGQVQLFSTKTLWHNSFDDLLANDDQATTARLAATASAAAFAAAAGDGLALPENMSDECKAVVASTRQGRDLRKAAEKLGVLVNHPIGGLVMAAPKTKNVSLQEDLSFKVVGPVKHRVVQFQRRWKKDLRKILAKEQESANATAMEDDSPFNLASICVLAKCRKKTMLLTGDARGDYLLEGLEQAKVLKPDESLHVNLLKLPHHGSDRNVDDDFFKRITADHYVASGNGEHGNPEPETLRMIARARGDADYTLHLTITRDAHLHERNEKRKKAIKAIHAWVKDERPGNCTVVYRDPSHGTHSLVVDLLEPYFESE